MTTPKQAAIMAGMTEDEADEYAKAIEAREVLLGVSIDFWKHIDAQLVRVMTAQSVDEVLAACPPVMFDGSPNPGSDGFFEGSGGNTSMFEALGYAPGWVIETYKAEYYFSMRDPHGDILSYVEGDLYRGDQLQKSAHP